jgi:hypothetical protein
MSAYLGNNYWLIVGPLIMVVAIIVWVLLTVQAARRRNPKVQRDQVPEDQPHRGAVQGGVIEGDPGQRNRRDEAPRRS